MQYLSVCSGIEAASVAWSPLGFEALAFAEVDKFPSAVLAHHYPQVPNLGDMTLASQWSNYEPNILVGGTPCQSFSVAGLRKGLADPRGNLMLTYLAIADRYQPEWVVWENVPGVLSSGSGRDFGTFLGALGQIGYGWAYRVLDAQFFGVPQRRRRVFVVGHLGDWRRAAAVLFERHSLQGHPPPSREARQGVAGTVAPCIRAGGNRTGGDRPYGSDVDTADSLQVIHCADVAHTTTTHQAKGGDPTTDNYVAHSLRGEGFDASEDGTGRGTPLVTVGALACNTGPNGHDAGNFACNQAVDAGHVLPISIRTAQTSSNGCGINDEGTSYTLDGAQGQAVAFTTEQTPKFNSDCALTLTKQSPTGGGQPQAIAFDCKASGQNGFGVGEIASTMRSMGHSNSHQNGGGHQAVAYALQDDTTPKVSLELNGALRRDAGGEGAGAAIQPDTCYNKGIDRGANHASTQEGNAGTLLSRVQKEIGAQAFAEWGLGILDSLQHPEVLRQALHGSELRPTTFSRRWVVYCTLSREEDRASGAMLSLLEACGERCPSQGWEPLEQLAGQLGAYLSGLSQPGAQAEKFMRDLWIADEGAGVLREALSAIQEARRPAAREGQPAHAAMQVRRLTPECCEFLQGFPRGYTSVPFTHGKPAADGPRYKALGNSMAVPVMRWIGERIQLVDWLHAND